MRKVINHSRVVETFSMYLCGKKAFEKLIRNKDNIKKLPTQVVPFCDVILRNFPFEYVNTNAIVKQLQDQCLSKQLQEERAVSKFNKIVDSNIVRIHYKDDSKRKSVEPEDNNELRLLASTSISENEFNSSKYDFLRCNEESEELFSSDDNAAAPVSPIFKPIQNTKMKNTKSDHNNTQESIVSDCATEKNDTLDTSTASSSLLQTDGQMIMKNSVIDSACKKDSDSGNSEVAAKNESPTRENDTRQKESTDTEAVRWLTAEEMDRLMPPCKPIHISPEKRAHEMGRLDHYFHQMEQDFRTHTEFDKYRLGKYVIMRERNPLRRTYSDSAIHTLGRELKKQWSPLYWNIDYPSQSECDFADLFNEERFQVSTGKQFILKDELRAPDISKVKFKAIDKLSQDKESEDKVDEVEFALDSVKANDAENAENNTATSDLSTTVDENLSDSDATVISYTVSVKQEPNPDDDDAFGQDDEQQPQSNAVLEITVKNEDVLSDVENDVSIIQVLEAKETKKEGKAVPTPEDQFYIDYLNESQVLIEMKTSKPRTFTQEEVDSDGNTVHVRKHGTFAVHFQDLSLQYK